MVQVDSCQSQCQIVVSRQRDIRQCPELRKLLKESCLRKKTPTFNTNFTVLSLYSRLTNTGLNQSKDTNQIQICNVVLKSGRCKTKDGRINITCKEPSRNLLFSLLILCFNLYCGYFGEKLQSGQKI